MRFKERQRSLRVGMSILITLASFIGAAAGLKAPRAEAGTSWPGGSAAGSGSAPWQGLTKLDLGAGIHLAVNVVNGNLLTTVDTASLPGVSGFDLPISPHYNSLSSASGTDMGNGWLLGTGADIGLVVNSSSATFYDATGQGYAFTEPSSCPFTAPAGIDAAPADRPRIGTPQGQAG